QDVVPGRILGRRCLVIRNDVEQQAQVARVERPPQRDEILLAAELGIEPGRVDDVVAVRAAGTRSQDRRAVEVRHAEAGEVGDDPAGGGEWKLACELETVGRAHHVRRDARSERGPGSKMRARCRNPRLAPDTVAGWRSRSRRPGPRAMYTRRANRVPR